MLPPWWAVRRSVMLDEQRALEWSFRCGVPALAWAAVFAFMRSQDRSALNALLVTLLDDDEPPRWSDVALSHICGPAAHVEVNGRPLLHGSVIPAAAFTVRWSMDQCTPLEAFELSGVVELLVFHEDETGLSAVIVPHRMLVSSAHGTERLSTPSAASMSLLANQHEP